MEDIRINTNNLEVSKLGAMDQSKIINLKEENAKRYAAAKSESAAQNESSDTAKEIQVDKLVEMANRMVTRFSTKITFLYDPETKVRKILVTEKDTGKVIRQIPPEQMVDLMKKMEEIAGIIYNGRA